MSQSKAQVKTQPKMKTIEMVAYAIHVTQDRKGTTREQMWKCISSTKDFQESIRDKKIFFTQLKRLSTSDGILEKSKDNMQRYKLNAKFKEKVKKAIAKGMEPFKAVKSSMTTKAVNPKKPISKMKKAKMSKTTKGQKKLSQMSK